MGQASKGAIASAESAPAASAISRRCQPQARTMLWIGAFNFTAGAANFDSADLTHRALRLGGAVVP
jgi:hypothetical protein